MKVIDTYIVEVEKQLTELYLLETGKYALQVPTARYFERRTFEIEIITKKYALELIKMSKK